TASTTGAWIQYQGAGSGTLQDLFIGNSTNGYFIRSSGHLHPINNNNYDLGAPNARMRVGYFGNIDNSGYSQFTEMADPAAGAANTARFYARDNGAGKTQLVVRFNTGAVQVIATEP
ncbi:MAG TPA: hypothetical protein VIY07_09570, partial [Pseudolabrys sp.]